MFATRTLVSQLGRKGVRYLSTTKYSIYEERRAIVAAIGLTGIAGTWLYTQRNDATDANIAAETKEHPETKHVHVVVANQPSATRTKVVGVRVEEDTSRCESNAEQAISAGPQTSQVEALKADSTLNQAQPIEPTAPIVEPRRDSKPKRLVGGNYTAAKKHDDNEDDEKWFTC